MLFAQNRSNAMKRPLPLLILSALLLMLLGGCTRHYYYGVPADDWHRMSEQERLEIIRVYQERRLHEERRRAAEAEIRAREMAQQHPYYPELIYVHLSGGVFLYQGRRYAYHAHDLRLRQGEARVIELVSVDGGSSHRVKLWVRYHEGKVMLGDGRRYLRSFDYRDSWKDEEHYKGIKLRGDLLLDGASMTIGSRPRGNATPRFDRAQDSDRDVRQPRPQEEGGTPPLRPESVPAPGNHGLPEKTLSKQQQIKQEQEIREEQREERRSEKASRREAQKALLREKRESRQEMVKEKQEALRQKQEAKQAEQKEQHNNSKPAAQGRLKGETLKEQAKQRIEDKKAKQRKAGKGKEEKGQEASPECVAPGEKRTGNNKNLPECGG